MNAAQHRPCAIHPSILSADFMRLEEQLQAIATADAVHVDVMDNHFVPNLTLGPPVVAGVQRVSPVPLDVHLMIEDPDRWAPAYAELGAASVTFHAEAATAPIRLARTIRSLGAKAAVALRPATPVEPWLPLLGEFDMVLLMSVEPGFGGQAFLETTLPRIRTLRRAIDEQGAGTALQIDGGVTTGTIVAAAEAGADTFVAGSAVYGADDAAAAIAALRAAASGTGTRG